MAGLKHKIFAAEYVKDFNATRAARRAGYSHKTAAQIGHKLLQQPDVIQELSRLLHARQMTKEEVLVRLTDEARADQADFWDIPEEGGEPVLNLARAKREGKTHLIKKIKIKTNKRIVTKDDVTTEYITVETDLDLYDSQNAKALLGKHHKLFTDKSEISGPDGAPITTITADNMAQAKAELEQWKADRASEKKSNG